MKRLFGWLTTLHRYLGLVFCVIFLAWFASGIVMVYHRMPEYGTPERLARMAPLDPAAITLTAREAAAAAGLSEVPQRVYILPVRSRPAYRFLTRQGWVTVFADTGDRLAPLGATDAVAVAGELFPDHRATARHLEDVTQPDQWTIGQPFRITGPLHKVSLGDAAATEVYVAANTGEIAMKTDRASRLWGYAGPVLHWMYFRPLRVQGGVWLNLIIYGSLVGCVLAVLGIAIGLYRYSFRRRFKGGTSGTPYAGWLRWHHYAGLLFGAFTFTWMLSGMLSVVPWNWSPGNGPDPQQVLAVRGSRIVLEKFVLPPAKALELIHAEFRPSEIEFREFLGAPFYMAYERPADPARPIGSISAYSGEASLRHLLVQADGEQELLGELFSAEELLDAARVAMADAAVAEAAWLTEYDAYYYGKEGNRRLPVLRVKFNDADSTWLYVDAHDGSPVQREVTRSRIERWVYHGLHSLDFPWLYQNAWAWYPVVIGLSLGGFALSLTATIVAWRFLRAKARPEAEAAL